MTEILDPSEAFKPSSPYFGSKVSPAARIVKPVRLPWRVVIDTAEQQPYTFANLSADADHHNRPIAVQTVTRCLGRYPHSLGDYSLESVDGSYYDPAAWCYVERKSLEDCQGTLLGFADGHRERFERELANMRDVFLAGGACLVVVECDLCELLMSTPPQRQVAGNGRQVVAPIRHFAVASTGPLAFVGVVGWEITTLRFGIV